MLASLAEALITKGAITRNTEIEVEFVSKDLSGNIGVKVIDTFAVKKVTKTSTGKLMFEVNRTNDGQVYKFDAESIVGIDGMEPGRFASVYGLKPDGSKPKNIKIDPLTGLPVQRGRKPNWVKELMKNGQGSGDQQA